MEAQVERVRKEGFVIGNPTQTWLPFQKFVKDGRFHATDILPIGRGGILVQVRHGNVTKEGRETTTSTALVQVRGVEKKGPSSTMIMQ